MAISLGVVCLSFLYCAVEVWGWGMDREVWG